MTIKTAPLTEEEVAHVLSLMDTWLEAYGEWLLRFPSDERPDGRIFIVVVAWFIVHFFQSMGRVEPETRRAALTWIVQTVEHAFEQQMH